MSVTVESRSRETQLSCLMFSSTMASMLLLATLAWSRWSSERGCNCDRCWRYWVRVGRVVERREGWVERAASSCTQREAAGGAGSMSMGGSVGDVKVV